METESYQCNIHTWGQGRGPSEKGKLGNSGTQATAVSGALDPVSDLSPDKELHSSTNKSTRQDARLLVLETVGSPAQNSPEVSILASLICHSNPSTSWRNGHETTPVRGIIGGYGQHGQAGAQMLSNRGGQNRR